MKGVLIKSAFNSYLPTPKSNGKPDISFSLITTGKISLRSSANWDIPELDIVTFILFPFPKSIGAFISDPPNNPPLLFICVSKDGSFLSPIAIARRIKSDGIGCNSILSSPKSIFNR